MVVAYWRAIAASAWRPKAGLRAWLPLLTIVLVAAVFGSVSAVPMAAGYEGSRAVRAFAFRTVIHSMALALLFAWLWGWKVGHRERQRRAESNG